MRRAFCRPFLEQGYTVWWVTRRQNMPAGYSFADMADDYGQLIADEFDGRVDVVVGMSTGGQIGFYLAARHPDRAGHFVIATAGYQDGERAKAILLPSARLLSEGKIGEATALMTSDMFPSWPRPAVRALAELMGRSMYGGAHQHFANDVLVEAEAEWACDAREVLPRIPVPVLLVCGDRDPWCPRDIYEETARLIPTCTLVMYAGKAHEDVLTDSRFGRDVAAFISGRSLDTADASAGRPAARPHGHSASGPVEHRTAPPERH
jgi:pimeloyl-ACP methyl ester carboxylesterase